MRMGLTTRQAAFLSWLREDPARQDMSFQEMADGFGLASKSNVFALLNQLEAKGCVQRLRNRARSLEVLPSFPSQVQLRLVAGPHHWDRRAAEKRRIWTMQEGGIAA